MPVWENQAGEHRFGRENHDGNEYLILRNMASQKSCQPCGCDEAAGHVCEGHTKQAIFAEDMRGTSPGLGGAPTRATTLPGDGVARKKHPVASGVLDYFPDALIALSHVSWQGNEQHNPGQPLHWNRSKSGDEADTLIRHFLQRGTLDTDGLRHTAKVAWRALAMLQKELEAGQ